ncbi:hypothetical protein BGX24_001856 [Mortierella sp. AD032]|nr:hypothetical protein BGX24_001856 [Mortierella sp. AD032]
MRRGAIIKDLKSKIEVNNTTIDPKAAGTSVGTRIKGHQKRGGPKLTKEHRKYGTVAHTNESRTSRIYVPVFLSRGRQARDGESKTVKFNGSVDCKFQRAHGD